MNPQPAQQIPGVYHRKVGDIVVSAISDGYLDSTLEVMRNVDLDKAREKVAGAARAVESAAARAGASPSRPPSNSAGTLRLERCVPSS